MVAGFGYLAMYAYKISWQGAVVAFVLSFLAPLIGVAVEKIVDYRVISLIAVPVWPVLAYGAFELM
jgi:hypothetical protein